MSDFSYRPKNSHFKTWSEMTRERYEEAVRAGRVSKLTSSRCEVCTRQLTAKVLAFSRRHFNRPLCFRCQETERYLSEGGE